MLKPKRKPQPRIKIHRNIPTVIDKDKIKKNIESIYVEYSKTEKTKTDQRRLAGRLSGLKRREKQEARLPILVKIFRQLQIKPTLNVCKHIDNEIFGITSNFQKYNEYFDIKSGRRDKIFDDEIIKIEGTRTQFKKYIKEWIKVQSDLEKFFSSDRNTLESFANRIKSGGKVEQEVKELIIDEQPELIL